MTNIIIIQCIEYNAYNIMHEIKCIEPMHRINCIKIYITALGNFAILYETLAGWDV